MMQKTRQIKIRCEFLFSFFHLFYICGLESGELPEWSNGADSKSVDLHLWVRGFESLALR